MENLYEILGVPRSASEAEIYAAYRIQAFQYHSGYNRNYIPQEAAQKFRKFSKAFEVLADPRKRRHYDAVLDASCQACNLRQRVHGTPMNEMAAESDYRVPQIAFPNVQQNFSVSFSVMPKSILKKFTFNFRKASSITRSFQNGVLVETRTTHSNSNKGVAVDYYENGMLKSCMVNGVPVQQMFSF